ncbi:MAG: ABC transporter permease [Candidatus Cloacimonadales bacterium]
MNIWENIRSSFYSIFSHKVRTSLTLIGITIGVMAVILMFSTISGIKSLIADNMEGMGWNNSLIIQPGEAETNAANQRFRFSRLRREAKPLSYGDYLALKGFAEIKTIYGMVENWERNRQTIGRRWTQLRATNVDYFTSKSYGLKEGRYFNAFEESSAAKVCVVGYHYAQTYFANTSALGQDVNFQNSTYRIIGVLDEDKLNVEGFNFNTWERTRDLRAVYIPLATGAKYLRSSNAVDFIYIQSHNPESFQSMKTSVTQLLLAKHNMARDFSFQDVGAMMLKINKEMDEMMNKWSITLMAIAGISLFVGGIGLFSTLLISINERMMEIGIRKSIGASERDVFGLFLSESLILSIIAALQGIFLSWLIITIASNQIDFSFSIPSRGVVIGIVFSTFIGLVSGIYPAYKASKIDPIKAIYYLD